MARPVGGDLGDDEGYEGRGDEDQNPEREDDADDPLRDRLRRALPHYDIGRRVGAGGMGVIFRARHRALEMPVAIKVLRPELATAHGAERFLREAQHLAAVNHPSIVTIHHVNNDGGLYHFIMEWLDHTLEDRLKRGSMPWRDVVRMARELLDGLARVHASGIVHRDIKPSNIFFMKDGRAKLGDFGIARRYGPQETPITEPGPSPGTLKYMSPEQLVSGDVAATSDLYQVGMVCFEALAGRAFPARTDPSHARWNGVRRRPRRVLERALALEPARRWPDARAFADALTQTQPTPGGFLTVGSAAVVAISVVTAGILRGCPPPVAQSEVAVLPFPVEGGSPSTGELMAMAIELNLKRAFGDSGLTVTPEALSAPWAARRGDGTDLPSGAWDDLRTNRIVRGRVRVVGDSLDVAAVLLGQDGDTLVATSVMGHRNDPLGIAHRIGRAVVQVVRPEQASRYQGPGALSPVADATNLLVAAEYAFQRDNWTAADSLYGQAISLDSSLALAWWGLFNARRWQRAPPGMDLADVYARYGRRFDDLERRLIGADLAATVTERLDIYAGAIARYPWNAYPRLLRGNELFHRGALVGKGLDSAIAELALAAHENPYLAATWDMLAWAHTRAGDRAGAASAVEARKRLGQAQPVADFSILQVLDLAVIMRFGTRDQADQALDEVLKSPDGRSSLLQAVRLGLSLGLLEAQRQIGEALALDPHPAVQTQALTARALAALALGRPAEALPLLERAGRIAGDAEYALQADQWALVLPALGLPGISDARRDSARARLAAVRGGLRAARAHWTLTVDAPAAGRLPPRLDAAPEAAGRLAALGTALWTAARGDTAAALAMTDTLLRYVLHADLADPLQRAVLYLARARWLETRDPLAADRAYGWYENADFADWPRGPPQAAELDWALETFARYERARLGNARGEQDPTCRLAPEAAARWARAEPAYASLRDALSTWMTGCTAS